MPIEREDASRLAALFAGETLSDDAREAILAAGAEHVPALQRLLVDPHLARPDAPGHGHAPIHAAVLLAELGVVEAIAPMLDVLARTDVHNPLHDRIVVEMPRIGSAVIAPVIAAHDATTDDDLRVSHCEMLSRCGVLDERIRERLVAAWDHSPDLVIQMMARYGDPAMIPYVERTFARHAEDGAQVDLELLVEAGRALTDLGALTDAQRDTIIELYTLVTGGPPPSLPEMPAALVTIGDAPNELLGDAPNLMAYAELLAAAWNFELFERIGDTAAAQRAVEEYRDHEDPVAIGRRILAMIEAKRRLWPWDPRQITALEVRTENGQRGLVVEWEIVTAKPVALD